ncbi:phage terminase small subunit [Actinokineospora baliensis]|uniref:phage terminase small subunit n=1 Tax=Actinokineospora baliensis TaxID=547056 RepID=UPI003FD6CD1B
MSARGPIPKRSDQRVRRNKDSGAPIQQVAAIGAVDVPALSIPDAHPMIEDFYRSLIDSAQSRFYEPSDWQFARFTLHFADRLVKSSKPSAQMLTAVNSALTDLLVSEGSRRRVRLEIEREQAAGTVIDVAEMFRQQLTAAS